MQKILILSDTHGYLDPRLLPHVDWADQIWHGGDWGSVAIADTLSALKPVMGVYGNIDGTEIRSIYSLTQVFELEGLRIGMTHIAGKPGAYKPDARALLQQHPQLDVLVCGHSHILSVQRDPKYPQLLFVNPGAAGKEGFHRIQTAIRLKLDQKRIFDVEVVEIGRRGTLP
jgi:hypothetical protein